MLIEDLCAKRLRHVPSEISSLSNQLLLKGGFIHQNMGGIFTLSHLGYKVLAKVSNIIRKEMDNIGFQEFIMPVVTPASLWQETGRVDTIDILAGFQGKEGHEYIMACTHEEICVDFVRHQLESYKQLPIKLYQIQTKFRDELRPRAGLLRVREFMMKDAYSFHATRDSLRETYNVVLNAYHRIYRQLGFANIIDIESDSGDMGGAISHEFMLLSDSGEDTVILCTHCDYKANKEVARSSRDGVTIDNDVREGDLCIKCSQELAIKSGIELGNIFQQDQYYTSKMNCVYNSDHGSQEHPFQGAYGIGVTRIIGALADIYGDSKGIMWPVSVAPFHIYICVLGSSDDAVRQEAITLYESLKSSNIEVILDTRSHVNMGVQLGDAEAIGVPLVLVFSNRNAAQNQVEVKSRSQEYKDIPQFLSLDGIEEDIRMLISNHLA